MSAKHLRILIADADPQLRFNVEKMMNNAGCFGVATVGSLDELLALIDFPGRPFDRVLINRRLLGPETTEALKTLGRHRNVVIYRSGFRFDRLADPVCSTTDSVVQAFGQNRTLH